MNRLLFVTIVAAVLSLYAAATAAEPERKLYRVTIGLNERGHVIAKSDKLGTVVLGFDNLGDVTFVHKETVRRLKEKLPLTAEISGFVYPDDKEMFSTKLFNWVKP